MLNFRSCYDHRKKSIYILTHIIVLGINISSNESDGNTPISEGGVSCD